MLPPAVQLATGVLTFRATAPQTRMRKLTGKRPRPSPSQRRERLIGTWPGISDLAERQRPFIQMVENACRKLDRAERAVELGNKFK